MSENHEKNLSELLEKRRAIIGRIATQMPSEAAALEAINLALEVTSHIVAEDPKRSGPYVGVQRGIDAIMMHLRAAGKPVERRKLVAEVLAGGWAAGDPMAYAKLWDVVRYHSKVSKKSPIVRRGDTITLAKGAK